MKKRLSIILIFCILIIFIAGCTGEGNMGNHDHKPYEYTFLNDEEVYQHLMKLDNDVMIKADEYINFADLFPDIDFSKFGAVFRLNNLAPAENVQISNAEKEKTIGFSINVYSREELHIGSLHEKMKISYEARLEKLKKENPAEFEEWKKDYGLINNLEAAQKYKYGHIYKSINGKEVIWYFQNGIVEQLDYYVEDYRLVIKATFYYGEKQIDPSTAKVPGLEPIIKLFDTINGDGAIDALLTRFDAEVAKKEKK